MIILVSTSGFWSLLSPDELAHVGILNNPRTSLCWKSALSRGVPVCADNGAYVGFKPGRFRAFCERIPRPIPHLFKWIAVPDVVGDARETLARFKQWEPWLGGLGLPLAFVAQDGAEKEGVPWDDIAALFIGGTTQWKLSVHACDLVRQAKRRGKWAHMGRVNSWRRIRTANQWGCDSVDGSAYSAFWQRHLRKGIMQIQAEESRLLLPF